jgi:hypothetical protein
LIFAVNFTCPPAGCASLPKDFNFNNIVIYLPPEFEPPVQWTSGDTSNVITTVTDDYANIKVHQTDLTDPFGPGWWAVFVRGSIDFLRSQGFSEWYYLRLNGMIAPLVAGRYFFKIFVNSTFPVRSSISSSGAITPLVTTMPVENWPVLLVKGEEDPAILSGTIRYGGSNATLYNVPIQASGRVIASGVALDPSTDTLTGRRVEAWGFFNASANGHYEVEGVAPGIYNVYVSAAGFPEIVVAENLTIYEGQSIREDFHVVPGPVVRGEIFSKNGLGLLSWPSRRPVYIEIYDSNAWSNLENATWDQEHLKSISPINFTSLPYTSYVYGNAVWKTTIQPFDTPPKPRMVAFPWEGPVSYYAYTEPPLSTVTPKDPFGVANGVGPAQVWWVDPSGFPTGGGDSNSFGLGSTPTSFRWQFGVEGLFGVPSNLDGHVPQALATWVDGLSAGSYYLRAWVSQYVQTDASGAFEDYRFTIEPGEFAPDVFVPVDLRLGGTINVTVHFHDLPGLISDSPIGGPDPGRYIIAEAYDASTNAYSAFNFTFLASRNRTGSVALSGFGMAGPNNFIAPGGAGTFGMKYSLLRYRNIRDYGLVPGSYILKIYTRGYLQLSSLQVSVVATSTIHVSLAMIRGAGLNITLYSKDYENPTVFRSWAWPSSRISVIPSRSDGTEYGLVRVWNRTTWISPTQPSGEISLPFPGSNIRIEYNGSTRLEVFGPDSAVPPTPTESAIEGEAAVRGLFNVAGFLWSSGLYRNSFEISTVALPTDVYSIRAFTYGYVQEQPPLTYASTGSQADIAVYLTIGVNLTLLIKFKREALFTSNPFNMSMRVRVYNELGQLVAATETSSAFPPPFSVNYVPSGATEVQWTIAGFHSYTEIDQAHYRAYGIAGAPDYAGGWTVELDTVNMYSPHTFFPPVDGLLLGESYHTVDDFGTGFVGNEFAFNHLGPWEQKGIIQILNAHMSGEASIETSLNLRGLVRGTVVGSTFDVGARTISWAQINFTNPNITETHYSYDGFYEAYLNGGNYNLTVTAWTNKGEAYRQISFAVTIPDGSRTSVNIFLDRSGVPIPEVEGTSLLLIPILASAIGTISSLRAKKTLRRPKASAGSKSKLPPSPRGVRK